MGSHAMLGAIFCVASYCVRSLAMTTASARPGLVCHHCYHSFALADVGIRSAEVSLLPDPFPLKCPRCGDNGTYSKSSIGRLVTEGIFKSS